MQSYSKLLIIFKTNTLYLLFCSQKSSVRTILLSQRHAIHYIGFRHDSAIQVNLIALAATKSRQNPLDYCEWYSLYPRA